MNQIKKTVLICDKTRAATPQKNNRKHYTSTQGSSYMKQGQFTLCLLAAGISLASAQAVAETFTVSTTAELRQALRDASNGSEDDTIMLQPGTYVTNADEKGTLIYSIDTPQNLTLEGVVSGESGVVLDGAAVGTIMKAESKNHYTSSLTLKSLTLKNGEQGLNVSQFNLTLDQVTIADNALPDGTASGYRGAGLYMVGSSANQVVLKNSLIQNNRFTNVSSGEGGGAYISSAKLIIENSRFLNNAAGGQGGGLHASIVEMSGTTFENNAISDASVPNYNSGCDGAALTATRLTMTQSEVTGNSGLNSAVCVGYATIDRSQFRNNGARFGASALTVSSAGSSITNSVFVGNSVSEPLDSSSTLLIGGGLKFLNNLLKNNVAAQDLYYDYGATISTSGSPGPNTNLVLNTIFADTSRVAIAGDTDAIVYIQNNYLDMANVSIAEANQLQAQDNLTAEFPGLAEDFTLTSDSPLIDAGKNDANWAVLPSVDLAGKARLHNGAVDIGPYEFGAGEVQGVISEFKVMTSSPKIMETVQFSVAYTPLEGRTLKSATVKVDNETDVGASLDADNHFNIVFVEPGSHQVSIDVTDSEDAVVSSTLTLTVATRPIEDVIQQTQALCAENPQNCGIDAATFTQVCRTDPASCGINPDDWVNQGYTVGVAEGRQECSENPASCNIQQVAVVSTAMLPTQPGAWKLLGSGIEIRDLSLFAGVTVVWSYQDGAWKAYSPSAETTSILSGNGVASFRTIPANTGFWVRK